MYRLQTAGVQGNNISRAPPSSPCITTRRPIGSGSDNTKRLPEVLGATQRA